jgi:site-specific recombinase XerD
MAADLIDMFSDYQRGRGFSRNTVKRRRVSLTAFANHIAPLPLERATPELIEEWVYAFETPSTKHAYLADLRVFYKWAHRRQLVKENPCDRVDSIKVPRTLPRPVDAAMIPMLVAMAGSHKLALMVALAAYAGLRRAEIARLDYSDINTSADPATLTVRGGKGGKDRTIPVHPALLRLLERRSSGSVLGVTADTVGSSVADYLRSCGIDASIHQLRHTFATEAARAGGSDPYLIAELLGHSKLDTTLQYVSLVGRDTAPVVAAMYGTPPTGSVTVPLVA